MFIRPKTEIAMMVYCTLAVTYGRCYTKNIDLSMKLINKKKMKKKRM